MRGYMLPTKKDHVYWRGLCEPMKLFYNIISTNQEDYLRPNKLQGFFRS